MNERELATAIYEAAKLIAEALNNVAAAIRQNSGAGQVWLTPGKGYGGNS